MPSGTATPGARSAPRSACPNRPPSSASATDLPDVPSKRQGGRLGSPEATSGHRTRWYEHPRVGSAVRAELAVDRFSSSNPRPALQLRGQSGLAGRRGEPPGEACQADRDRRSHLAVRGGERVPWDAGCPAGVAGIDDSPTIPGNRTMGNRTICFQVPHRFLPLLDGAYLPLKSAFHRACSTVDTLRRNARHHSPQHFQNLGHGW